MTELDKEPRTWDKQQPARARQRQQKLGDHETKSLNNQTNVFRKHDLKLQINNPRGYKREHSCDIEGLEIIIGGNKNG